MRSTFVILVLLLAVPAFADEPPLWLTDWPAAQDQARLKNQPIFVVLNCRH